MKPRLLTAVLKWGVSLVDKQLEAGVKLTSEFGDSGVLVANASVDQHGDAKVSANFKVKF